jgi:hypothetical protein
MKRERENDGFPWQMNAVMVILNEEKVSHLLGDTFFCTDRLELAADFFCSETPCKGN